MPILKITDLALETSLTEAETSSIVGGFGSFGRSRNTGSGNRRNRNTRDIFKDNFQFQSNVGIAQGNSNIGSNGKQDNFSDVNIFFL